MKLSNPDEVRDMYDATADSYAEMMNSEIDLPVYADTLGRLSTRIADVPGTLVDTSCGSGHMLSMYHERYERTRSLLGIDLSSRMVAIAGKKLGTAGGAEVGDMRDLGMIESGSAAAVLSFFAIHHLDPEGVGVALAEWYRVLRPGGELLIAAWEGQGTIDYGDAADIVALRYSVEEIRSFAETTGLLVQRCVSEPVDGFPMDAIYMEASKPGE